MTKTRSWGIRLLCLLMGLVTVACLALPAQASDALESNTTLTTVVRNAPSYRASPIGQMEDGTALTVLDRAGSFYKVDCYDMTGYIAASQVIAGENEEYYVNCDPESSETRIFTYADHSEALQLRHSLFGLAREQLGKPYIYGSTGMRGFDCSGLMYYLFGAHEINLHRTASQQLQDGIVVDAEHMQVGDLVFFHESWDSYPASHVGIYVGNNQVIHASSSRGVVCDDLDMTWLAQNYLCVRRIVDTGVAPMELVAASVTSSVANTGRRAS